MKMAMEEDAATDRLDWLTLSAANRVTRQLGLLAGLTDETDIVCSCSKCRPQGESAQ